MAKPVIDVRQVWSNGQAAVRVRHVGYGWGHLYKNMDGTHCLMKADGRKYLVRSLEEIKEWSCFVEERVTKGGPTLYDMNMRMNNVKGHADGEV